MAKENKELEIQTKEPVDQETERTRECRCFVPRADIYEAGDKIFIALDMPGIHENAIEITLEKDILNIKGYTQIEELEDYTLAFSEYEAGDYERSFRISDSIDRNKIEAVYKDGVLRLTLPKVEEAKARKIEVRVD